MEKTTGQKLKELREDRDLKQVYVAKLLETSQTMIWQWENDITMMKIDKLKKMCLLYGVSADYLLGLPKGMKYLGK